MKPPEEKTRRQKITAQVLGVVVVLLALLIAFWAYDSQQAQQKRDSRDYGRCVVAGGTDCN